MKTDRYRNTTNLTRWVRFLLYLQIAYAIASIAATAVQNHILVQLQDDAHSGHLHTMVDNLDNTLGILELFYFVIFIASVTLIGRWIYIANSNARQLGAQGMEFTPGWSVGWYFIPIANIWKPFLAMREIWKASHRPAAWQSAPGSPLLGWWWGFGWPII